MANYILRQLDDELWTQFKQRVEREHGFLKPTMLRLIKDYTSYGFYMNDDTRQSDSTMMMAMLKRAKWNYYLSGDDIIVIVTNGYIRYTFKLDGSLESIAIVG